MSFGVRTPHASGARSPQAGDHAQQRALSAAAGADDQQPLPGLHRQRQVADQGALVVGCLHGDVLERQTCVVHRHDRCGRADRAGFGFVEHARERMQPVAAGGEPAQPLEVLDDHRHRAEDRCEGARRLDGPPHFELAGHHTRGDDRAGQHDGQEAEAVLERIQVQLPADQPTVVVECGLKVRLDLRRLVRLTAMEGDRLGVLAHPHQAETEIGLAAQLVEVQRDQARTEHQRRDERADDRIDDQEVHQFARDRPEHAAERDQLDHRAQHHHQEVQRLLGKAVDVLRDALVGIVDVDARVQTVIRALVEVAVDEVAGQPATPADAQRIAHVVVERPDRHGHDDDRDAGADRRPEARRVAGGQCRRELAGLLVQQDVEAGLAEQQQHQQCEHAARAPLLAGLPVGPGNVLEMLDQLTVEAGHWSSRAGSGAVDRPGRAILGHPRNESQSEVGRPPANARRPSRGRARRHRRIRRLPPAGWSDRSRAWRRARPLRRRRRPGWPSRRRPAVRRTTPAAASDRHRRSRCRPRTSSVRR